jgi:hypothetical protein
MDENAMHAGVAQMLTILPLVILVRYPFARVQEVRRIVGEMLLAMLEE